MSFLSCLFYSSIISFIPCYSPLFHTEYLNREA